MQVLMDHSVRYDLPRRWPEVAIVCFTIVATWSSPMLRPLACTRCARWCYSQRCCASACSSSQVQGASPVPNAAADEGESSGNQHNMNADAISDGQWPRPMPSNLMLWILVVIVSFANGLTRVADPCITGSNMRLSDVLFVTFHPRYFVCVSVFAIGAIELAVAELGEELGQTAGNWCLGWFQSFDRGTRGYDWEGPHASRSFAPFPTGSSDGMARGGADDIDEIDELIGAPYANRG